MPKKQTETLRQTARDMVAPGRGILAMDESHPTCAARFKKLGIADSEQKRREYRDLLVTAPGLGEFVSGAILFDETIRQQTLAGDSFPAHLARAGIVPGIKVDTGAKPLAGFDGEKVTEGLDGLRERLAEYRELGARFAKWRAVIAIAGADKPSRACLTANAHALARYAALCQEAALVPIVEPEVLMDGDHDIARCFEVTRAAQQIVFEQLREQNVLLEGIVLKPSMVVSGAGCAVRAPLAEVAEQTVRCLKMTVPHEVPGIAFLSGGQSDEEATAHLNAMNALGRNLPWALTFSYGRALQQAAMAAWGGDAANREAAQKVAAHRARMNGLAASGTWSADMEKLAA
ncbi:MAG: fructose-bisphosphate aldolase class I [Gammaproteobacteria bacterium]|nr:fructose-bisphosphate aldolase class I [Gammaproteobacteria bacterium]MDD9800107.1 fructose-bisphosphate aldolase class I [Gammaproteobacteria bacterium]MDD9814551.1 fructose-bisphosphate aldolase class I [Gammaproteobacteria bacterium]MDD9850835.1 fructose-bisphosphate aldolase class I [Gammaproteobacteria bacterium]MDD9871296.1 fructose-bisphosphate aldolase class I [Gammaproteobacteria bacterium]